MVIFGKSKKLIKELRERVLALELKQKEQKDMIDKCCKVIEEMQQKLVDLDKKANDIAIDVVNLKDDGISPSQLINEYLLGKEEK